MITPTRLYRDVVFPNSVELVYSPSTDPAYVKDVVLTRSNFEPAGGSVRGQYILYLDQGGGDYVLQRGSIGTSETVIIHLDIPLDAGDEFSIGYEGPATMPSLNVHVSGYV